MSDIIEYPHQFDEVGQCNYCELWEHSWQGTECERNPNRLEARISTLEVERDEAITRAEKAEKRTADFQDGSVRLQRHRDAWRRYSYQKAPRPQDFLDGNMVQEDRGETWEERALKAEHELAAARTEASNRQIALGRAEGERDAARAALAAKDEAINRVLVGGNHLASSLIGWLGADHSRFPAHNASYEYARTIITDVAIYDAWVCWKTIMEAREALSAPAPWQPLQDGCNRVNRETFEKLVAEDLEWLLAQPRTLERDHIEAIVKTATDQHYAPQQPKSTKALELMEDLETYEFQTEGGYLVNAVPWIRLKALIQGKPLGFSEGIEWGLGQAPAPQQPDRRDIRRSGASSAEEWLSGDDPTEETPRQIADRREAERWNGEAVETLRAAVRVIEAAREKLKRAKQHVQHREDTAEVCYDWCPRCLIDAALDSLGSAT